MLYSFGVWAFFCCIFVGILWATWLQNSPYHTLSGEWSWQSYVCYKKTDGQSKRWTDKGQCL